MAKPACQRIQNPPGDCFTSLSQRHQYAERRVPGGVIVGAVDRIDDPAQRIAQLTEQRWVGMCCLLAYNRRFV